MHQIAVALAVVALLAGGGYWYQVERNIVRAPEYKVGDKWTFLSHCDLSHLPTKYREDKAFVEDICGPKTVTISGIDSGKAKSIMTYKSGKEGFSLGHVHTNKDGEMPSASQYVKFPFNVGEEWQVTTQDNFDGAQSQSQTHIRAVRWEQVTVPAGSFMTLRLEKETKTIGTGRLEGTSYHKEIDWYSPEAKVSARIMRNGRVVSELESYAVK